MYYTDMRDFEPEYTTEIDGLTVEISKVGGGTVGEQYEGRWIYHVTRGDKIIMFGNDLYTGTPKTHAQAAQLVYDFQSGE